jgi:hypothetical protein
MAAVDKGGENIVQVDVPAEWKTLTNGEFKGLEREEVMCLTLLKT